jgi:hypothetical protein
MTKIRVLIFLLTIVVVGSLGTIISLYARGYRFDVKTFRFEPNGLFVVKSDPDGAQVFINTELKTATNATVPLPPDTYDVEIRKEGYFSWKKRLVIEKEIVTEANASLFKAVPSLSAVTFSGNINPVPTNDLTKIAYAVPKTGLWVIETVNLPLGFAKDPRQITDGDLTGASWEWSPNGREILLTTKTGIFLLDAGRFTPQNQRVNITSGKTEILAEWEEKRKIKLTAQIRGLPEELVDILERKTSSIIFSPDETKILYTASSSAELADNLIKPLPGASTQKQERQIKAGKTYVYDIKEDRNFSVSNSAATLRWFPTSQHLVLAEDGKITIMDYDGTNRQEVYSGSYISPHAFPTVNKERLLILTNLGADSVLPNLYSLSLK